MRASIDMARRRIVLLAWLLLNLGILAWTWASYGAQSDPQLKAEIVLRHGLLLLGLTLPSGWLLTALSGLPAKSTNAEDATMATGVER